MSVRWVDTNKGSDEEPNYRSRLVGREIKTSDRPDLFAAMPPLEAKNVSFRLAASRMKYGHTRDEKMNVCVQMTCT